MRSRISAVAAAVLASLFLARSGAVEQAPAQADAGRMVHPSTDRDMR